MIDISFTDKVTHKTVSLDDCVEIASSAFREPHGLFFVDNDTIVVANRLGDASILKVPPKNIGTPSVTLNPITSIRGSVFHRLKSPGSVSVVDRGHGLYDVLICNNYIHRVTRHTVDSNHGYRITANHLLLHQHLNVPDGVAVSKNRRWIAISNHKTHSVLLFDNSRPLNRWSEPSGVLGDMAYPHGLCFGFDDRCLFVADAGAPYVHVFESNLACWQGDRKPVTSIKVLDDSTFFRGRSNQEEGGPKGLDVDTDMGILVTTCEHQVLAFFETVGMLPH